MRSAVTSAEVSRRSVSPVWRTVCTWARRSTDISTRSFSTSISRVLSRPSCSRTGAISSAVALSRPSWAASAVAPCRSSVSLRDDLEVVEQRLPVGRDLLGPGDGRVALGDRAGHLRGDRGRLGLGRRRLAAGVGHARAGLGDAGLGLGHVGAGLPELGAGVGRLRARGRGLGPGVGRSGLGLGHLGARGRQGRLGARVGRVAVGTGEATADQHPGDDAHEQRHDQQQERDRVHGHEHAGAH